MIIRPPVASDIPALALFGRSSFVEKFGHIYQPEDLNPFLEQVYSETAVAMEMADPSLIFRIAVDEAGTLAGYCKISLTSSFTDHMRGTKTMELRQLYADPARTGQGIGAHLMDWAMAEFAAQGADEVHISVWSENFGAQRFYARYGFDWLADVAFWVGRHRDHEFLYSRMF